MPSAAKKPFDCARKIGAWYGVACQLRRKVILSVDMLSLCVCKRRARMDFSTSDRDLDALYMLEFGPVEVANVPRAGGVGRSREADLSRPHDSQRA